MLNIIRFILLKSLILGFLVSIHNTLNNFEFYKRINNVYLIVGFILFYILIEYILKIKENFENKKPKTNTELSPMIKSQIEEKPNKEEEQKEANEEPERIEITAEDLKEEKPEIKVTKPEDREMTLDEQKIKVQELPAKEDPDMDKLVEKPNKKLEDLQEVQKNYVIMPVESWIDNDITLMQKKQVGESCSCPTIMDNNQYMKY